MPMISIVPGNETADFPDIRPLLALQQVDAGPAGVTGLKNESDDEARDERGKLLCKICRNLITSSAYRIEINGAHSHTFINPMGLVFNIGCFMNARGCYIVGKPTPEYTWFPGYAWCYLLCTGCRNHLGWYYHSGEGSFYGLILDLLIEE